MEQFNILLKCKGSVQTHELAKEIEKVCKFHGKEFNPSARYVEMSRSEKDFYFTFNLVRKQLTGYDWYIDYLPQYHLEIEFENRHQLLELTKIPFDEFDKIHTNVWLLECFLMIEKAEKIDKVTEILKIMNQYKTHTQYNQEIDHIRKATEQKITELRKQEQQQIESLKAIPDKNIEIGLKNYNEYSQRNIDLSEFKKMLNENYNTMLMFCFEKSEFQHKEMAEEINIAIC
jgi:hypothetical protein